MNTRFLATCAESGATISQPGDSPYASPNFPDAYKTDWSLVKRCVFWFSMLAIAIAGINSITLWIEYRKSTLYGDMTSIGQVESFLFGPSGKFMRRQ